MIIYYPFLELSALTVSSTPANNTINNFGDQEVQDVSLNNNNNLTAAAAARVVGGVAVDNNNTNTENNNNINNNHLAEKIAAVSAAASSKKTSKSSKSADNEDSDDEEDSSSSKNDKNNGNGSNSTKVRFPDMGKLVNGCTPLEDQFHDAKEMFVADVEMAARVAAVYRDYDTVEMPRYSTEDFVEYGRRTASAFLEKAPSAKAVAENPDPCQPFYIVDLGQIVTQYAKFKKCLPGVQIHYAVKCNNSESIVAMIAALGGCFDCASLPEIKQVLDPGYARTHIVNNFNGAKHSKAGGKIIFANPCKQPYHMQQAEALGVTRVTFDNQDELLKIQQYMPSAEAILRIKTEDANAVCQFSVKFGCPRTEAKDLMTFAKEIGVNIVGVSFHVGSGNSDPTSYHTALRDARDLFDFGERELGFKMTVVDLGGGWAGSDPVAPKDPSAKRELSFEELTAAIRPVLYELFPLDKTEIFAEPGRFFGAGCHQLCLNVHSKRRVQHANGVTEHQYYVTDGMYQSFNCMYFDHQVPNFHCVEEKDTKETRTTTMFGPTCDSMDAIMKCQPFPELKVGEWLFVPEFGAYTCAAGSTFNGFSTRRKEYISSLPSGVVPYLAE